MINEGLRFMRTVITLVTVNQAAFAPVCQRCLCEGVTAAASISQQPLPRWEAERKSPLRRSTAKEAIPNSNPDTPQQSYCTTVSDHGVNEIPLAQPPECHRFRNRSATPWRSRGLWVLCRPEPFVSPTFNSRLVDSGCKHSAW